MEHLPLEIFGLIVDNLVPMIGIYKAVRLRVVNSKPRPPLSSAREHVS